MGKGKDLPMQEKILERLPDLAPYSPEQVEHHSNSLVGAIGIGLDRIDRNAPPEENDGGLMALPFPVLPRPLSELQACPAQEILACVFAGKNWQAEILPWTGLFWQEPRAIYKRSISEGERTFRGSEALKQFTGLMARVANGCLSQLSLDERQKISRAAVSFGFPQENWQVDNGINTCLIKATKHWSVENGIRRRIGEPFLTRLQEQGDNQFRWFVFANDTIGTALDVLAGQFPKALITPEGGLVMTNFTPPGTEAILPVGVVIGNGANTATKYGDMLVNLETGQAKIEALFGQDPILTRMKQLGLTPEGEAEMRLEFAFSGAYQLPRLIGSLDLLAEQGVMKKEIGQSFLKVLLEKGNDPRILDQLITGEINQDQLGDYLRQSINQQEFEYIKETTQLVMSKAVEVAALMIAAPVKVSGYSSGYLPVVGSVFWKAKVGANGEVFGSEVIKLVNQWLSGSYGAVLADELRGISGLALEKKA